jgi:tetratricopeptide (TPR) repeat protein
MWEEDMSSPNPFSIGAGLREQGSATCSAVDEQHCTNCGCSSPSIFRQDEDSHANKLALDRRESIIKEQEIALFLSKEAHEVFETTLVKRLVELEDRERALEDRERALGDREHALGDRERALGDREIALFLNNEQLDEQKQAFRERALGDREIALGDRERALGDREIALFLNNEQLDEQKQAFRKREQEFRKREQAHEEHLSEVYLRGLKK